MALERLCTCLLFSSGYVTEGKTFFCIIILNKFIVVKFTSPPYFIFFCATQKFCATSISLCFLHEILPKSFGKCTIRAK